MFNGLNWESLTIPDAIVISTTIVALAAIIIVAIWRWSE